MFIQKSVYYSPCYHNCKNIFQFRFTWYDYAIKKVSFSDICLESPGKRRIKVYAQYKILYTDWGITRLGDRARFVFIKPLFDQEDRDSVWTSSVKKCACSCIVVNYHCIGDGHDRLLVSEMVKPQRSHRTSILFLCDWWPTLKSEDKGRTAFVIWLTQQTRFRTTNNEAV